MGAINWVEFNEHFQYYTSDIILEIIDLFVDEYDGRMENLKQNIAEVDMKSLSFNVHSLKSVIGNFKAEQAYEIARRMEEMAKTGVIDGLSNQFSLLLNATEQLRNELIEYRSKYK